ncbi:hypothetical protein A3B02_01395 [Candidatus Roizmanbacteria bacterium RIFCSPLOWO2_01_FULL_42_14]|uniref:Adenylate kinase n=4 Tax=Candidatus Roizmaniibacteriota TaxID=1752723 RepID=A0A1F7JV22_9BACT|nr:MAG: hypothetical protein A3D08_01990 [Candidatus Roizmanbacteria bacterium RIFCSPHIGHO2_02_FULL_43_11]OGK38613.1 MAG: hypothetical protein A3F32_03165 [Candidatus Roizmanbacteria bacterium RIFCSPHIGHO2_12_FULL_42_10]OGK52207.1 MAG: hypothetical protein A3B02_01395 [Candidatus Roizmanbacteria bacterium RIFCSPLOWO2_01_FULL_42_14]OGK59440.1 MAG: hypothetical protein A3I56_02080 [Candidatus Roizmanbacteria bacterium RIFCSPLOWO2_02_FULL_43_10]
MNIVLIGIPGSGKSTQGKLLSEKLEIPYIAMGGILRDIADESTKRGKRIKTTLEHGDLLPDDEVIAIAREYLSKPENSHGYIIDGFPRTVNQAQNFSHDIDTVLLVMLDDKEALWRIALRIDPRNDQSAATIMHRLKVFHRDTDPLIEFYKQAGVLHEIDGYPSIEEVHTAILKELGHDTV